MPRSLSRAFPLLFREIFSYLHKISKLHIEQAPDQPLFCSIAFCVRRVQVTVVPSQSVHSTLSAYLALKSAGLSIITP